MDRITDKYQPGDILKCYYQYYVVVNIEENGLMTLFCLGTKKFVKRAVNSGGMFAFRKVA